jgi:hypothetical protein
VSEDKQTYTCHSDPVIPCVHDWRFLRQASISTPENQFRSIPVDVFYCTKNPAHRMIVPCE